MELFEQHRFPFQQQCSYCQEPDYIWQKGLAEEERRCSCSSKVMQRRYKVSQHRRPNFHSLHFTQQHFHVRCNTHGAKPGPWPQPENNYTLLNILLKSKCMCWRCGSKQKNKCLIKEFTGKGQVTWPWTSASSQKRDSDFSFAHFSSTSTAESCDLRIRGDAKREACKRQNAVDVCFVRGDVQHNTNGLTSCHHQQGSKHCNCIHILYMC